MHVNHWGFLFGDWLIHVFSPFFYCVFSFSSVCSNFLHNLVSNPWSLLDIAIVPSHLSQFCGTETLIMLLANSYFSLFILLDKIFQAKDIFLYFLYKLYSITSQFLGPQSFQTLFLYIVWVRNPNLFFSPYWDFRSLILSTNNPSPSPYFWGINLIMPISHS